MSKGTDREQLDAEGYVPHSQERKKAVLMYAIIGILLSIGSDSRSTYESFHLKQAIGYWFLILFLLIITLPFWFFISISRVFRFYGLFYFVLLVAIFCGFVYAKQARNGTYTISRWGPMALSYGIGNWIITLFAE